MQLNRSRLAAVAAVMGAAAAPVAVATAQSGGGPGSGQNGQPLAEATFFAAAAAGNQFEVQTGQLAARRARRSCVRRFARDLVRDHTRQQAELRTVAAARGATLGTPAPTAAQTRDLGLLRRTSSRSFDDRFLRIQLSAHVTAIRLFQSAATGQPAFSASDSSTQGGGGSGSGDDGSGSGGNGGSAQATTPTAGSLPVVQLAVRSLPILGRHYGEADILRRYGCDSSSSRSGSSNSTSNGSNGSDDSTGSDDSSSSR